MTEMHRKQTDDSSISGVDFSDGNSEIEGGDGHEERKNKQEAELASITKAENKAVFWLRALLAVVMVASAITVTLLVYKYSSSSEQNEFEARYTSDAQKLFEAIGTNFDLTMGAADAFMFRVVSQARSTNARWPMVTIPDLAVQTAKLIAQTDSIYMTFYPLITGKERAEWENFTKHNDGWVEEALRVQAGNPNFHGPILENYTKSHVIWKNEGPEPEDNPGPFAPSWMGSPVIPYYYPYNWNALAYEAFARSWLFCMETLSVVVTAVANHADPDDPVAVSQAGVTSDWAIPYLEPGENPNEPFADMYYPVIDEIDDVIMDVTNETKALGVVAFSFYWRHVLKNILPPDSKGAVIVFGNMCGNQSFTYQIDGKTPIFGGFGDLHEERFDDMSLTRKLTEVTNRDGTYTGRPMTNDLCPYSLTIYPSSTMENGHITNDPILYTVVAALIFLFTSALFLAYDWFVNRRQRLIKQRALASGAIVSSLFPDQVRSQLYEENKVKDNREAPFKAGNHEIDRRNVPVGRPIANLYKEATCFFGDLAGFTEWSSSRTPVEVFDLLETLYGEFDRLAARRSVFKVETVGDCYVAVTGVPNPDPQHAVTMVRFARDCLERMSVLTRELAEKLGQDTETLSMRIGLNSGPVTAGVLRGEKGRFQLFGDTVNTTARMESTGVKDRIQVSKATADELIKFGKKSWLVPRGHRVEAKGKGEMETFFVTVKRSKCSTVSSTFTDDMAGGSSTGGDTSIGRREAGLSATSSGDETTESMTSVVDV